MMNLHKTSVNLTVVSLFFHGDLRELLMRSYLENKSYTGLLNKYSKKREHRRFNSAVSKVDNFMEGSGRVERKYPTNSMIIEVTKGIHDFLPNLRIKPTAHRTTISCQSIRYVVD
jgi:hypothetical protein